jgi:hypothetical protein
MKRILAAVLGVAILMTVGCADPVAPATPTPAIPTVTDTFSDTLLVLGSNTHNFTVGQIGGVTVTLTNVTPGAAIGVGIGTPSLGTCNVLDRLAPAVAGPTAVLSGTATVVGTYCVTVYDIGNLVESATYIVNVLHS